MVLAAAIAGLGSKKVHSFRELSKCQTRTRFPADIIGSNAASTSTAGNGVGVGVGPGVGVDAGNNTESATQKPNSRSLSATVASTRWRPSAKVGTATGNENVPYSLETGAVSGKTEVPPMVSEVIVVKAKKPDPLTNTVEPEGPLLGTTSIDPPGTACVADAERLVWQPVGSAVTVLFEGTGIPHGT